MDLGMDPGEDLVEGGAIATAGLREDRGDFGRIGHDLKDIRPCGRQNTPEDPAAGPGPFAAPRAVPDPPDGPEGGGGDPFGRGRGRRASLGCTSPGVYCASTPESESQRCPMPRRPTTPLIGRAAERDILVQTIAQVVAGKGSIVLVAGEAGIGKTRLIEDVLDASELLALSACAHEETVAPYGPIAALLRRDLANARGGGPDWGPLAPYLALLLPELGPPPSASDPEHLPEAALGALLAIARRRPTALFLDDLQWADDASLDLLRRLAERIGSEPILLIASYRSDELPRGHALRRLRSDLRRFRHVQEISLGPLDETDSGTLLAHCLQGDPNPALLSTVFLQTHGLPLFIEELAAALLSDRRLRPGPRGLELPTGDSVPIPESVRDVVELRMDLLGEDARNQLEIAALTGAEFELELVTSLAGTEAGLEELLRSTLVEETASGHGAFRHGLVRAAVRAGVPWTKRRALHRRIATYLERIGAPPERVAEHWLEAQELDAARRSLIAVADRACHIHAYRDAARAGERALRIWAAGEDEEARVGALRRFAHCAQASGDLGSAADALRQILASTALEGDLRSQADALRNLATVETLEGAGEAALEHHNAAATRYAEAGAIAEAALEWLAIGGRLTAMQALDRAIEATRTAGRLATVAERPDLVVRARGAEGNLLAMQGASEDGRRLAQEALSLALEQDLRDVAPEAYRRLASALDYSSDFAGSRDAYATAVEYCEATGDGPTARICLGCMSFIVFRTGEWKRAAEVIARVLGDHRSPPGSTAAAHGINGIVRAMRGETRAARKSLREALSLAQTHRIAITEMFARHGLALVAEFDGETSLAAETHGQVLEIWRTTQDRHDMVPVFLWQATFFGRHGRETETGERAAALATMASGLSNPETDAAVAHALGEVALLSGRFEEAVARFSRARDLFASLETPLELALTTWRAGVAAERAGDREPALQNLRSAYRALRNLGARAIATLVSTDLAALGESAEEGRSGAAPLREGLALTARQVEIVRLLSAGLTNKEIAQRLYLSPRTVDMHVSHALDRLDCRSRTEAARKAAELGLL